MDLSQLNNPAALLGGSAAIGLVATFWSKIKSFFQYIINFFIVTIKADQNLHDSICFYCWKNLKYIPFGFKNYSGSVQHVKPISRMQLVGFERIGKQTVFFSKKKLPIFVSMNDPNSNNSGRLNSSSASDFQISISFLRGTLNPDKFLIDVLDFYNDNIKVGWKRFLIEHIFGIRDTNRTQETQGMAKAIEQDIRYARVLKWKHEELGQEVVAFESALSVLAFPKEVENLIQDVKRWKMSEKWYKEKGIPWRRGWLLYGPPGTGKTSLVRALGYDFDMPIYVFDLTTLRNEELTQKWKYVLQQAPCIILLEDIDTIFDGRENKINDKLTFDCLLNCISGVNGSDGALLFITTNKIEKLDTALGVPSEKDSSISTRPGRIDRVLKLDKLDTTCRKVLANRILKDCSSFIEKTIKAGDGDTGAQFQERCTQIALNEFWEGKNV